MKQRVGFFTFLLILSTPAFCGDTVVTFDSLPSGAQVELDGRVIGTTPLSWKFPSFCLGRKRTAWSAHLSQPMQIRLIKEGYTPKVLVITDGPIHWRSFNGVNQYDYYLLSSTTFTVQLDTIQQFFPSKTVDAGATLVSTSSGSVSPPSTGSQLSSEQVSQLAFPAVVMISTNKGSGSGFFISPDGAVATNAHVVEGETTVTVITSNGKPLRSSAIYVDQDRDIALIKVSTSGNPFLLLQDSSTVSPGTEVIAIGSPGVGNLTLANTVTRGVVSGIRQGDHGVWVQTDASINPGNSGGPLLNREGRVLGLNTMKIIAPGYSGLNFALASSELAALLKTRFGYSQPQASPSPVSQSVSPKVTVAVTSTPPGADIEVDGVFSGSTPSELLLDVGLRKLRITKKGYSAYERTVSLTAGSKLSIAAELETAK